MTPNQPEDLKPYRAYLGLTMLQFLGSLALLGIIGEIIFRYIF